MSGSRLRGLLLVALITGLVVVYVRPWGRSYPVLAAQRESLAKVATSDDLQVALVWAGTGSESDAFREGVLIARDEINAGGGVKLIGDDGSSRRRTLRIQEFSAPGGNESTGRIRRTVDLARQIAADPNIVAVVGHSAEAAIAASVVYDACGVLFLSPSSTDPTLTAHSSPFVFRVSPSNQQIAEAMVELVPRIVRSKPVHLALLYPSLLTSRVGPNVVERWKERTKAIIQSNGGQVDFQVNVIQEYERDREDPRDIARDIARRFREGSGSFNVVLIADVDPYATAFRAHLDTALANTVARVHAPTILDLEELKWARAEDTYFRLDPSASDNFLDAVAQFVLGGVRQQAVVLYDRDGPQSRSSAGSQIGDELGEQISNLDRGLLYRLELALSRSYDTAAMDYSPLVAELLETPRDYVFLVGFGQPVLRLVEQLRRAGMNQPIIAGARVETLQVERMDAKLLGKLYLISTFNPDSRIQGVASFLEQYRGRNSAPKGANHERAAAYGYLSISLLGLAFERAGSASPRQAAAALRLFVDVNGIVGKNRFSLNGDLLGLPIIFNVADGSEPPHVIQSLPLRKTAEISREGPGPRQLGH